MKEKENEELVRELVEGLVDKYLAAESIRFSKFWRNDLVKRMMVAVEIPPDVDNLTEEQRQELTKAWEISIAITHEKMLIKNFEEAERWLRGKYSRLGVFDIEYIMGIATDKWRVTFNATSKSNWTNPELGFLKMLAFQAEADYVKKYSSVTEGSGDGEGAKLVGRLTEVPLDEFYDLEDPKSYFDADEVQIDAAAQKEDQDQEFIRSREAFSKPVKLGNRFYPYFSFTRIFRYLAIANKLNYNSNGNTIKARVVHQDGKPAYTEILHPTVRPEYQHADEAFTEIHEGSQVELPHSSWSAAYHKRRWGILRSASLISSMELAIAKLRESKDKKSVDLNHFASDSQSRQEIEKAPLIGAVVVCLNGMVFTCYKGQATDASIEEHHILQWTRHCEYSLFHEVVRPERMALVKGGTLFLTLEPCSKRGTYVRDGKPRAKIPCAVLCAEAGLKKIYLGSFDYNEKVFGKGREILRTGLYRFNLSDGAHVGNDNEIQGAELLEQHFKSKGHPLVSSNDTQRTYKIGEPVEVEFFDPNLVREIYDLNAEFLQRHKSDAFRQL